MPTTSQVLLKSHRLAKFVVICLKFGKKYVDNVEYKYKTKHKGAIKKKLSKNLHIILE